MSKSVIRTKSAHSFTVLWHPPRYPVKWVDTSEDVPPWDSTRGGDGYSFGVQRPVTQTYEEYIEGWNKFLSRKNKPQTKIMDCPRIFYPQLVRKDWTTMLPFEPFRDSHPEELVNSLARLIPQNRLTSLEQIIFSESFKQGVINIAEEFGVCSADNAGNALDWVAIGVFAATHLDLLSHLERQTDVFDGEVNIADLQSHLCKKWGLEPVVEGVRCEGSLSVAAHHVIFSHQNQITVEEKIKTTREYRSVTGNHLRENFKNFTQDPSMMKFEPRDSAIYLRVGIEGWLHWEIAALYDSYTKVKQCPGCGRPFVARGKRKWCEANSSTCRMRLNRQNLNS